MAHYLDTSALVKLIVREPETHALRSWLAAEDREPVSCDLTRTELMRAVRRAAPELASNAKRALDKVTITQVTTGVFEQAGRLEPVTLRSLDAIHLAAALDLGDDLHGVVTYDRVMADAARSCGMEVIAPADKWDQRRRSDPELGDQFLGG